MVDVLILASFAIAAVGVLIMLLAGRASREDDFDWEGLEALEDLDDLDPHTHRLRAGQIEDQKTRDHLSVVDPDRTSRGSDDNTRGQGQP